MATRRKATCGQRDEIQGDSRKEEGEAEIANSPSKIPARGPWAASSSVREATCPRRRGQRAPGWRCKQTRHLCPFPRREEEEAPRAGLGLGAHLGHLIGHALHPLCPPPFDAFKVSLVLDLFLWVVCTHRTMKKAERRRHKEGSASAPTLESRSRRIVKITSRGKGAKTHGETRTDAGQGRRQRT